MSQVSEYIKRAAERTKYNRVRFVEKNMPTISSNVKVVPFYGDLESVFIFSSFILKNYKILNEDQYFILCSWPDFEGLFPYVDEYWSIEDESVTKSIALGADSFYNTSDISSDLTRSLMECLDVISHRDWKRLWDRGFTDQYWKEYKGIYRYLPEVESVSKISGSLINQINHKSSKKPVVVFPSVKLQSWQKGKMVYLPIGQDFWNTLISRLIEEGYLPVVWQNTFTYDVSGEFTDSCVYVSNKKITDVLTIINYVGLILDVFSGVAKLAIPARASFLSVTERMKHFAYKDNEIFDLCNQSKGNFIFSFSTMLMTGTEKEWNTSLINQIVSKLSNVSKSSFSLHESYESISYDLVRERKSHRMGLKFINSKNK